MKTPSPALSLLIAFYNKIKDFELIWASIEKQSFSNFEVIICDDGSRPEIVDQIKLLVDKSEIPVQHIWHSDRGFMKNECLNRGILSSRSDYLVFIDADCVLHPEFLADHFIAQQKGTLVAGRRCDLTPFVTSRLTPKRIRQGYLQRNYWWIFWAIVWMKDANASKGIRISWNWLWKLVNRKHRNIVGCNFSVAKEDLVAVNGFDMSYDAPGFGEDSDIEIRLKRNGVRTKPFCFRGVQYHLYHRLLPRSEGNMARYLHLESCRKIITETGLRELQERER